MAELEHFHECYGGKDGRITMESNSSGMGSGSSTARKASRSSC